MHAQMKKISECAEVLPGYALKARAVHEPKGTHQILMAKHLDDGTPYHYRDEHELRIIPTGSPEKYQVRRGDVVFISRGVRNSASVIESVPEYTVASSTFYILRCKPEVNPEYLAWCINQQQVQTYISQVRTGAGTPIVQRNLFSEITIPVPLLNEQTRLADLSKLMMKERDLRKRLLDVTETYHRVLGSRLIDNLTDS